MKNSDYKLLLAEMKLAEKKTSKPVGASVRDTLTKISKAIKVIGYIIGGILVLAALIQFIDFGDYGLIFLCSGIMFIWGSVVMSAILNVLCDIANSLHSIENVSKMNEKG